MGKISSAVMDLYCFIIIVIATTITLTIVLHLNRYSSFYAPIVLLLFNLTPLTNIHHSLI